MSNAGYSRTPLVKKLGIKSGFRVAFLNAPDDYDETLGILPEDVDRHDMLDNGPYDLIQLFVIRRNQLSDQFPRCKAALEKSGTLWISWYKKAAKMDTDLTEGIVRRIGLDNGLVDVKVAAIDEKWSGLKFVYRKKDR